jgi:hypothetical protein
MEKVYKWPLTWKQEKPRQNNYQTILWGEAKQMQKSSDEFQREANTSHVSKDLGQFSLLG